MKLPGPEHPITIAPQPRRLRVVWQGRVLAETSRALELREAGYPPVQYIPREDVAMALLARGERRTHCPYKGDASYYGTAEAPDLAWSYEQPFPAMAAIAGHLAFYPGKVTLELT